MKYDREFVLSWKCIKLFYMTQDSTGYFTQRFITFTPLSPNQNNGVPNFYTNILLLIYDAHNQKKYSNVEGKWENNSTFCFVKATRSIFQIIGEKNA